MATAEVDSAELATARRILVVQYAGDYRDTWHRLQGGGPETYLAQAYSDRAIAQWALDGSEVQVVIGITTSAYFESLAERLTVVGLGYSGAVPEAPVVEAAARFRPTHLLLRSPMHRVLRWACQSDVNTLVTLADSFPRGLTSWLRFRPLVRLMNHPQVKWVGNHGTAASRALVELGVDPSKVIPWDWPHANSPEQWGVKALSADRERWNALYVGARVELKGVGDALRAVAVLSRRGFDVRLEVIGEGDDFTTLADSLGIAGRVLFRGRVANAEIIGAMRAADVVLVPSREEYPEGFPLTIYEALCSRTPLVTSDHPMFVAKLKPEASAVIFEAGNSDALADAIQRLLTSPDLYAALSAAALETWQGLQVPVKWAELADAWLDGTPERQRSLARHAWACWRYV